MGLGNWHTSCMRCGTRPAGPGDTCARECSRTAAHVLLMRASRPDDNRAREYAQAALDGVITMTEARKSMGWLLAMSGLPEYWARSYTLGDMAYLCEEVQDAIMDSLMRKCCQAEGSGLDLTMLAQGFKLSSWAYGLCRNHQFRLTVMRSVNSVRDRGGYSITLGQMSDCTSDETALYGSLTTQARSDDTDPAVRSDIEDKARFITTRAKTGSRIHIGARHLADHHGLTVAKGPRTKAQRQRMFDEIRARTSAPAIAVREALADDSSPLSFPALSEVFAGSYTPTELDRLSQAPAEISYAIAMSAATPRPAVNRSVRGALIALAKARSAELDWTILSGRLVHAFLVSLADLPSEDSNAFRGATVRSAAAARRDEKDFLNLADEAAVFPGSPLGPIAAGVETEIHTLLVAAETAIAGAAADAEVTLHLAS